MKRFKSFLVFLFALIFALPSIGFASWFIVSQKDVDPIDIQPTTERAVAYVGSDTPSSRYTLHRAVDVAAMGSIKDVYVIPGSIIDLNEPLNIPNGVSVYVPYTDKTYVNEAPFSKSKTLADSTSGLVNANRKSLINLSSTIDIAAGAKFYLGGSFNAWGITGNYCEINFKTSDSNINVNGKFECYGYLKETVLPGANVKRLSFNQGSELFTMFAYYQNLNAGYANTTNSNKVCPINKFDFPNLQVDVFAFYGSYVRAVVHAVASDESATSTVPIVGPATSTAKEIFFMVQGAPTDHIRLKFVSSSKPYTPNYDIAKKNSTHTQIDFYTNINLGYLNLSLSVSIATITVSTQNIALPFSHRIHFTIKSGYTFNMNYSLKFLGGSKITIDHGATLNVKNSLIFYDDSTIDRYLDNAVTYPKSTVGYGPGTLIINGTIAIDSNGSIGGIAHTDNLNGSAKIDLRNASEKSLHAQTLEGINGEKVAIFFQGFIPKVEDATEKRTINFVKGTEIFSLVGVSDCWNGNASNTVPTKKIEIQVGSIDPSEESVFSYSINVWIDTNSSNVVNLVTNSKEVGTFNLSVEYTFDIVVKRVVLSKVVASNGDGPILNFQNTNYPVSEGDYLFIITPSEAAIFDAEYRGQVIDTNGVYTWDTNGWRGTGQTYVEVFESNDGGITYEKIHERANFPDSKDVKIVKDSKFYFTLEYYLKITWEGSYTSEYIEWFDAKPGTSENFIGTSLDPINDSPQAPHEGMGHFPKDKNSAIVATANYYRFRAEGKKNEESGCLTEDTLITMADGSYKRAGDVHAGDVLKVFNHETGQLDVAPVVFNDDIDSVAAEHNVLYLEFANGKTVKTVDVHGFFDKTTMRYEYITENNYQNFIGHRFASISGDVVGETTLRNAYIKTEFVKYVSPVTTFHLNVIAEDMLSMTGGIYGLFNMFEFDASLQYNQEMKEADIEKYGLFTYEDFEDLVPYEFFAFFPAPYLKVAIGKGMITWDDVLVMIERYLAPAMNQNQ